MEAGCNALRCHASANRESNPIISASLLQHASVQQAARAPAQQQLHLNCAHVACHHVLQHASSPAQCRPDAHVRTGRSGRRSITRLHREAEHKSHSLGWPKRDLHAAEGCRWRRTAAREGQHALDEHERGDDLEVVHEGNTQDLPQEEIVIVEHRGKLHAPTLCKRGTPEESLRHSP